jgi:hypothetical protein
MTDARREFRSGRILSGYGVSVGGPSDFVGGIDGEEHVISQKMFVMVALAMQFHKHFGAPWKPEAGIGGGEGDRAVVDEKMIASKFEFALRSSEVGLNT